MMELLQVVVGKQGYRDPAGNPARNELLDEFLRLATESSATGVVLPAGFWTVNAPSQVAPFAESVRGRVGRCGIAVIAGIDVAMSGTANSGKRRPLSSAASKKGPGLKHGRLPYYGFAIDSSGALVGPFQQESRTAEDASVARPLVPESRWVRIGDGNVAVLVCGECHNEAYRRALAEQPADAVAIIGHDGLGQGLVPTICCIARLTQRPVLHVQHLATKAGLHFADATAVNRSVAAGNTARAPRTAEEPWFAWAIRKVRARRTPPHQKVSKGS